MSKFYLLDHSLRGVGGHHYEYALHTCRQAQDRYDQVILAVHRDFSAAEEFDPSWQVLPVFSDDTYSPYCAFFSRPYVEPGRAQRWSHRLRQAVIRPWRKWRHTQGRTRHLQNFLASCSEVFSQYPLAPGDQVFVPTLSELDLEGLVMYFQVDPASRNVDWRLQFHFDVFEGRPGEYPVQTDRSDEMRRSFSRSLAQAAGQRLSLYNTTPELAAQYQQLGVAHFEAMPYPVNPAIQPADSVVDDSGSSALTGERRRVTCGGYFRREKGRRHLRELVTRLAPELGSQGRVQLVVQGSARQIHKTVGAIRSTGQLRDDAIVTPPHPLSMEQYAELIQRADIGLFLYDGRRYYARCSGVLVEMLAAGVPVITPAGCWLAEQFAEASRDHYQQLATHPERQESVLARRSLLQADAGPAAFPLNLETPAADLLLRFRWRAPAEPGALVRLRCQQFDRKNSLVASSTAIAGFHQGDAVAGLFHLEPQTVRIQAELENAYDQRDLELENLTAITLPAEEDGRLRPLGSVGLAFDAQEDIPRLLNDMLDHYDHYRASSLAFSETWRNDHHPGQILDRFQSPAAASPQRVA
ncbi:glycosyltransferase family protein [Lignipirellula cremea]|uniref:Glycosyl transferases group 1 n=1 Tax=Lignipirellula cremea TaxID=2528010 RepID=A0A518DYN8_9BACT|nr:glycosyltransferase family 4 protein [Lignipirellula cremea]QDU96944.1 hypothetical protein Pla8534_47690 [Lignipirellula cremea]